MTDKELEQRLKRSQRFQPEEFKKTLECVKDLSIREVMKEFGVKYGKFRLILNDIENDIIYTLEFSNTNLGRQIKGRVNGRFAHNLKHEFFHDTTLISEIVNKIHGEN